MILIILSMMLTVEVYSAVLSSTSSCLDLTNWTLQIHDGNGTGSMFVADDGCDGVHFRASQDSGMAASLYSPKFQIEEPGHTFETSLQLSTIDLIPNQGGPSSGAATLTGNVYLHFFDINGDSGAWNPQFGTLAPSNANNVSVKSTFTAPTTAASFQIHIAFAAHTFTYRYVYLSSFKTIFITTLQFKQSEPHVRGASKR